MADVGEKSNNTILTNSCETRNSVVECVPYLPFSSNSSSETSETSDIMGTSSRLLPLGLPEVKGLQLSPGHPWPAAGQHHQGDCPDHPVMVRGAMLEMKTRAQKCIDANGGHFEKKRGAVTIVCHIEVAETSWLKSKLNLFKIYVTPEFSPPFRWLNTIQ